MITQEQTTQWVGALRSGDYPQGSGALRVEQWFCCLGVLCEVIGLPRVPGGYETDGHFIGTGVPYSLVGASAQDTLINMNDHGSVPFDEIAEFIETNGAEWLSR